MDRHCKSKPPTSVNRRGAIALEFAIVLPILLIVILGMIECGRAIMAIQLVSNVARAGAREASLEDSSNIEVEELVTRLCTTQLHVDPDDITVGITTTTGAGDEDPGGDVGSAQPGDLCEVSVSLPFRSVSWLPPQFLRDTQLVGRCAMQHE
jgi:Flp pilus assembly protein TadG